MTQRPRRTFTTEQKAEAVKIVQQSGKSVNQVARELDLTPSALRKWIKQAQIDQHPIPGGPLTSAERQELNQLRRDLKRVQMERDFLKNHLHASACPNRLETQKDLTGDEDGTPILVELQLLL
ncbi:transposase [Acaryochloris marina]|uniref:Transposase n=1 Tax=Acaryochloris marina (strain MBIC 11017) TaxID=329726 RepID=A8ZKK0_ACAM1|nr:transposase [Acaryochloris marina]ABW31700.1 transposase [Acaryochloris marina MBIC11017]